MTGFDTSKNSHLFPMKLYLLRHANADTRAATDDERPLSEKGIEQAKRVGRFCREKGIAPEIVLSSPLTRARQTAEHFLSEQPLGAPVVAAFLASGMGPETAVSELKAYGKFESVMIVGHEPDFSVLVAHLIGLPANSNFVVRKGSLTLLDVPALRAGAASLEFSIPCRLM